jgi:hypothetical protein
MTITTEPVSGVGVTVGVAGTAVKVGVIAGVGNFVMPVLSSPQDVI